MFHGCRFSLPSSAPEGLWFLHIHHIGEFENSSKRSAPRSCDLHSIVRWLVSTAQSQLADVGSASNQSVQNPSTCRVCIIAGDSTIASPPTLFQLHAPALYRAILRPSPGRFRPLNDGQPSVKKMSARSSRLPNTLAHHASDVPQPSQVPQSDVGSIVVVASSAALAWLMSMFALVTTVMRMAMMVIMS